MHGVLRWTEVVIVCQLFLIVDLVENRCSSDPHGETSTNWTGVITSPNFGKGLYLNDEYCVQHVRVSFGSRVKVVFEFFDLESGRAGNSNDCWDYVQIADGQDSKVRQVVMHCGRKIPPALQSETNQLTITFSTDRSKVYRGFRIRYTGICDNDIIGPNALLQSPGYPSSPPIGISCQWRVKTFGSLRPAIHLESIGYAYTHCNQSGIKVLQTVNLQMLGYMCQAKADVFYPTEGNLIVMYHERETAPSTIFSINVTAVETNQCLSTPCASGATCVDHGNTYTCSCRKGFSGRWCDIQIDECTSSPCRNGGTCLDYFNRFECLCRPGLKGPRCEVDADECSSWPCLNGAKCIDGVNSYTCACASGFAGRHCEHDVDECLSRPCQNDGTCADERGEYRCLCPPGFSGRTCETVTDRCASHPCLNAATCRSAPAGGFTCACRDGFTGKRCESDVNECAASPCEAGATCVDRAPGFRCLCPPNRTGARCHDVIDHCHDGRCFNGGECISDELGFTCQCAPGFRGQTCERDVDECRSSPCSNGATCSNTLGGYSCECAAGYAGRLCQQETDECGSSPCSNGAVCRNRVAGYECVCREGFAGKNCEFEDSPCSSDPCLNGGRCVAYLRDFFCDCEPGHTGNTCATEIDDCAALPCRNNATCTDRPNGFLCACKSGYTGSTCAQEIDACTCHPCKNGGRCKNFQGSYNCQCSRGFSGVNCEGEVDECASGPCAHHGTCTDAVNAFDCECTEAYTGATCQDYIYKDEPHCVEEIDSFQGSGMYWPHTRAGYAKVLVCPPGVYGNATRECYHDATSSTNGTWGRPDLGGCVNPEFLKIAKTARKLLAKKHVAEIEILQITDSILTTINRNSNSSARLRLYPGDLAVSTDIAAIIADVVNRTGHFGRGLDDIAQGFGKIVGAVVHPLLVPVWKNANPNMVEQNMASLLTSTERLAENIFNQKPYQVSGSRLTSTGTLLMPEADFSVVAENVDFSVTTVSPKDNYTVLKSLQNGLQSSEISLPPEVLKTNRFHQTDSSLAVFSARFTSMGELLSLKSDRPDVSGNGSMINSDVMSCRVLGVPQGVFQQLSSPVVIVFKLQNSSFRNSLNDSCVFMNMSALSREDRWLWTGCRAVTRNDTHTVCHCFHLTNFALLMDVYGLASKLSKVNARALSYISYIGGTLSILGCLLSVCVFEYFRLRSDRIRIHEQLAVSIIFVQVVFLVGVDRKENLVACKAVAIILHYFIMAMFCWMFVEGVHLYVVLVKVFKTGSHLKKYLAMGWGIPLVVVGISVGVFFREYGKGNMCWMTTFMLQILFVPTVALVILLNTVVLIIVVRVMLRSLRSSHRANIEETSTIRVGLKATAVLLPLLGLTWTFGFLSIDAHNTLIFTYIFTALNCLQGLFFFIFHCLMNVDVRNAYKRRYRGRKRPATADRSYSAGHKTSADFESYGDFNGGKHIIRNSGTSVETNMTDMSSFERKRATLNEKHPNLLNRSTSNGIVRNGIKADRKATEKVEDVDSVKGRPAKDRKGKRVPRTENRMESESDKNDPGEVRNEEVTRYADETDSDDVTSGAHQTVDVGDNVAESDDVTSDVDGEVHKILSEMDSMLEEANKK